MQSIRDVKPLALQAVHALYLVNLGCICFFISNNTPLLLMALAGFVLYAVVYRNKPSLYMILCVAFFLFAILFSCLSGTHTGLARYYRIQIFSFLAGIAVYMAYRGKSNFLYPLAPMFCLSMGVILSINLFTTGLVVGSRLKIFSVHPNIVGIVSSMAVIASASHLLRGGAQAAYPASAGWCGWRGKLALILWFVHTRAVASFCMVFAFLMTILTQSRSALYSLLVALACCLLPSAVKQMGIKRFVLAVTVLSVVGVGVWTVAPVSDSQRRAMQTRLVRAMLNPLEELTFKSRMPAWESAVAMIREKPVLGHGYRTFRDEHRAYIAKHYTRFVKKFGKRWVDTDTSNMIHAHNQYLMTGVELGIVGLIPLVVLCFLWPFTVMVKRRTQFGPAGAVLVFFALNFVVESYLTRMPYAVAGTTFLFMTMGYLSCAMRGERQRLA